MLKLEFTEITEHKNTMPLSILNYTNQCTLNQSEDSLKIFCTPKRLELTGVQKLFPLCFFLFVRNNKGASD